MEYLGIAIFSCVILYIDYKCWIRGQENTLFFKDKTQLEKDIREVQKLEVKLKIEELKNKIKDK